MSTDELALTKRIADQRLLLQQVALRLWAISNLEVEYMHLGPVIAESGKAMLREYDPTLIGEEKKP